MGEVFNLPSSWELVSVADLGKVVSGGTPSTTEAAYWRNGNINWISPSDLTGYRNKFITKGAKSITLEGLKNSSATIMPAGSIHFSSRAPIGYTVISLCEITTNQGFKSLVPTKGIFNEYVYYYFKSAKQLAESKATGTTFKEISGTAFGKLSFPLPPLAEQHRIVAKIEELFSELELGIDNLNTARAQLKVYRQALLKHAFEGKLTAAWRSEHQDQLESARDLQKRIHQERTQRYQQQLAQWEGKSPSIPLLLRGKTSKTTSTAIVTNSVGTNIPLLEKGGLEGILSQPRIGSKPKAPKNLPPLTKEELAGLPELPKGWIYTKVGVVIDDPTYGTSKKCDYEVDGIGVLRIPNIVSGKVDASDLKFAQFTDDEVASYKLLAGDILIIRSNGSISIVGRCALIANDDIDYLYAGYLIRLRANQSLIDPKYLLNTFSLHAIRKQIEQKAKSTSGVNNINTGEIQSLVIAICSIAEQKQMILELDSKLSVIDQLDQTITTALEQAQALRQSILKKAFSGQLVPQDPQDEPAAILLARIKAEQALAMPALKKATAKRKNHA